MHPPSPNRTLPRTWPQNDHAKQSGFALIIALSLMACVLLLLLSISTLTQVEVRSSKIQTDRLHAEQNALLGLNTAIGQLQKLAGPDTRITAPAESISGVNGHKQVTGVWRSWEGRNHVTDNAALAGLPVVPNYGDKLLTGGFDPDSTHAGRFLGWLSSDALNQMDATNPPTLEEVIGVNSTVPLLGPDADMDIVDEVHVAPTSISDGARGRFAWWIGGENTKALVRHESTPTNTYDWSLQNATYNRADPAVFELDDEEKLNQISSRDSFDFMTTNADEPPLAREYFHDLTAWSRGLLTNAATGGWKRDISLATEDWSRIPTSEKSFFTLQPGVEIAASQTSLFPWESNLGDVNLSGAITWDAVKDFATQYRDSTGSGSAVDMPTKIYSYNDMTRRRREVKRYPLVARIHLVFSYAATPNPDLTAPASEAYIASLDVNPVVTLWNPYNVALTTEEPMMIQIWQPSDGAFLFRVDTAVGTTTSEYPKITMNEILGNQPWEITFENAGGDSELRFEPGEARLFSPRDDFPVSGGLQVTLAPGYRTQGGFRYDQLDYTGGTTSSILAGADDRFYARLLRQADFDGRDNDTRRGMRFKVFNGNNTVAFHKENGSGAAGFFDLVNPSPTDGPAGKLSLFNLDAAPDPFYASYISLNAASIDSFVTPSTSSPDNPLTGKGLLNNNPLNFWTEGNIGISSILHIKNYALNGTNGGIGLPEATPEGMGYVGINHRADQGATHLPLVELPLRPLRSLAELQHLDISVSKYAPDPLNTIGNSHAFPNVNYTPDQLSYQNPEWTYDYSHIANHLLFDDWFVSSIAPATSSWTATTTRTKESVYRDHLLETTPLPNDFYLPADRARSENAYDRVTEDIGATDAWRTIASKLVVRGMFNVNSTSVPAWEAVLRNARGAQVPEFEYQPSAIKLSSATSDKTSFPRATVDGSSDTSISNNPGIGHHSPLSDSQIRALAVKIVEQIKMRGPFLSLAEFINRHPTYTADTTLARAGAIEEALLELSDKGTANENPNASIQTILSTQTTVNNRNKGFPWAGEGSVLYGFPGWIRQADILRSLAPVISVRDDTFVIRSYGDCLDPITDEVVARAWCEAVVARKADYVDAADAATTLPAESTLNSAANARFGRQFEIISLRWLNTDEI